MEQFKKRLVEFARKRFDMGQNAFEDYCGINSPVDVTRSNGIRHTTETVPKYDMVSSHCARRTGITLLYMTGIPLQQVMLISGHKDEDSIRRYLRLTKEENVALLKDNPFFK